tara:strand:+ start:603 stop:734 length:132 start_codon:yes stop_codon:yes gene_type:complete
MYGCNDDSTFDPEAFAAFDLESKPTEQENTHRASYRSEEDLAE